MCKLNRYYLKGAVVVDLKLVFLWGFVLGALLTILLLPNSNLHKLASQELKNCEQSLPRNQSCKLTAIANENKNNEH